MCKIPPRRTLSASAPSPSPMIRASSLLTLAALVALPLAMAAWAPEATAQTRDDLPDFLFDPSYYSSKVYEKKADMDGNEVRITVFNYGLLAGVGEVRGEWPKGSNNNYVGDVLPIIVSEVPVDLDGDGIVDQLVRHVSTTRGPGNRGIPTNPNNPSEAWTFEPKPGFASNRIRPDTQEENDRLALSTDPLSWPGLLARPADVDRPRDRSRAVERVLRSQPVLGRPGELLLDRRQQRPRASAGAVQLHLGPQPAQPRRAGPGDEGARPAVEPVPRAGRHLLALRGHQHVGHDLPPRRGRPHRRHARGR